MCLISGWIYHEDLGSREERIAPGTRWEGRGERTDHLRNAGFEYAERRKNYE
jgi:hypothetical protein